MWLLDNEGELDPARNLALEEYALRHIDPPRSFLLLYVNRPSIVIGKNQNAFEEANLDQMHRHGTPLLRRISGGGAVYHDLGNLNFAFISRFRRGTLLRTLDRVAPIVETLRTLGAPVELRERGDIFLDGRKVSGNAQFTTTQRTLSHGTLLFDSDLGRISASLAANDGRFRSRATASRRSPVTNLRPHIVEAAPDLATLRAALIASLLETNGTTVPTRRLTAIEWAEVDRLAEERYSNWDWNFGYFREFTLERRRVMGSREVEMTLEVERGRIRFADFRSNGLPLAERESPAGRLKGVRYEPTCIGEALAARPPSAGSIEEWRALIY